jgi:hypothetical protein
MLASKFYWQIKFAANRLKYLRGFDQFETIKIIIS